jgi:hypothetical protein
MAQTLKEMRVRAIREPTERARLTQIAIDVSTSLARFITTKFPETQVGSVRSLGHG